MYIMELNFLHQCINIFEKHIIFASIVGGHDLRIIITVVSKVAFIIFAITLYNDNYNTAAACTYINIPTYLLQLPTECMYDIIIILCYSSAQTSVCLLSRRFSQCTRTLPKLRLYVCIQ